MPFRNSIVSAVIATAISGARVVIEQFGTVGGQIRFYTGILTETVPAALNASWQGSPLNRYILTLKGAVGTSPGGVTAPQIQLTTQEVTGDTAVNLIANDIYLFRSGGAAAGLHLSSGGPDVLGAWTTFVPQLNWAGAPHVAGASIFTAAYMQIGKIVFLRIKLETGVGWVPGGGTCAWLLPVVPKVRDQMGSGFLVNPVGLLAINWYCDAANQAQGFGQDSVGQFYIGAAQLPAGAGRQLSCSMTYEAL